MFTSSVVTVCIYFPKYRTVAMGLAMSGIGLGNFLYPFLAHQLIATYDWRGALIITSGLTLHVCISGMVMGRPACACAEDDNISKISQSNVSIPTVSRSAEERQAYPSPCSSRRVSLRPTSKFHSFVNLYYWLLHANVCLICFGFSVVLTHIIAYCEYLQHSSHFSSSLVAASGLAGLCGRIIKGIIAHNPSVNIILFYVICHVIAGSATLAMSVWTTKVGLGICMVAFGFSFAAYGPLLPEILHLLVGPEDFSYGYGFIIFSCGIGFVVGAPCAGKQTLTSPFFFFCEILLRLILLVSQNVRMPI